MESKDQLPSKTMYPKTQDGIPTCTLRISPFLKAFVLPSDQPTREMRNRLVSSSPNQNRIFDFADRPSQSRQVSDTTVVYVRTCRLQRRQRKLALFLPFVFPLCSVSVRYPTLEFPRLRPPATEPRVKHAHADHNVKRYCHMVLLSDSLSHLVSGRIRRLLMNHLATLRQIKHCKTTDR